MKNKKYSLTFHLSLLIFSCYILASIITFLFAGILIHFKVNIQLYGPLFLIISSLVSCTIIALIITSIKMKDNLKAINEVNKCLDAICMGNFNYKIDLKLRDPFINEIVDKLNKVLLELKSVSTLKKDFIHNFSHEFKTPIMSIKGFSDLLLNDKLLSNDEKNKYLRIISEESQRLSNLASNTLLLNKLTSEKIIINKELFYIDEHIEETLLLLSNQVYEKKLNVEIDVSHIKILASKELVTELWLNLFSNAIKYTDECGNIKIYSYEANNKLIVVFQDSGIGIEESSIKYIFNEYYQGDSSRYNNGIGLGLTISKKIIELHNWDIDVKSLLNQGTIFSIYLEKA